ncbi:hypothetical protein FRB90_004187 [Tulasnella sp. 427]|nr:hypothetical protein FRB90_004187 [Tulasnella sp. 427]
MNPLENEAVLAAALSTHPDQYTLLPTSDLLPGLIRRTGLSRWKVAIGVKGSEGQELQGEESPCEYQDYESYEAYCQATDGGEMKLGKPRFHKSMWPPANSNELGLENCLRIYPHLQNTGAFFVALIRKLPAQGFNTPENEPMEVSIDLQTDASETAPKSPTKRAGSPPEQQPAPKKAKVSKGSGRKELGRKTGMVIGSVGTNPGSAVFKEAPFTFIRETDPLLQETLQRLHLKSSFPAANVFVRHPPSDLMKTFYFCNAAVKSVILHNQLERIRLVSAGVKAFSRQDMGPAKSLPERPVADENAGQPDPGDDDVGAMINYLKDRQVALRFTNEGILTVVDFVDDEVKVRADLETLKSLLAAQFPLLDQLTSGNFSNIIRSKPTGSYIVIVEPESSGDAVLRHTLILPLWKSSTSVSLMVDKQGKSAISLQVFGKDVSVNSKPDGSSENKEPRDPEDEL